MLKAYDVALYFLFLAQKDGELLSNLKMQKLLYYAQGLFLAVYNKRLFREDLQAWQFGPAVKEVFFRLKKYKDLAIDFKELKHFKAKIYTREHLDLLPFVFKKYSPLSASALIKKTHSESPYVNSYDPLKPAIIKSEVIASYFKEKLKEKAKSYLQ